MGHDRRGMMLRLAALGAMSAASSLGASEPFLVRAVPQGEFLLERLVERGLSGGAMISVKRRWQCSFSGVAARMEAIGKQVECEVAAPVNLAPIAEIERQRVARGPFPSLIDRHGRIVGAVQEESAGKRAAVAAALAMLEQAGAPWDGPQPGYLRRFENAANAVISTVPADLFFPGNGSGFDRRDIELPDGATGIIEIRLEAASDTESGLLRSVERRISTRIGMDERVGRERWSLLPS